jgi:hypothetical protein
MTEVLRTCVQSHCKLITIKYIQTEFLREQSPKNINNSVTNKAFHNLEILDISEKNPTPSKTQNILKWYILA